MEGTRRVAIIGAAASGLPSTRHAVLYGFEPVVFEASDDIGGLWRFKKQDTDESSVMKSTIINTSKELTAYSDFPPPADFANFMHNEKVLEYLRLYAQHWDLLKYIRFRHKVFNIERSPSYEKTGSSKRFRTDEDTAEEFDGVVIALGHHCTPNFPPKWPGQDVFQGRIIHSHSYKDHKGLDDKVCVVVGVGNSGCDAAVELSRFAKMVYLVTRRGTWVYSRIFEHGVPYDIFLNSRFNAFMMSILPESTVCNYLENKLESRFDHANYGLKPAHRILGAHPTANDELPSRIASGMVCVKPNIKEFTETDVIFEDGTVAENVDLVVLATGYTYNFDIVENGKLIKVDRNKSDLYQFVFPLVTADHNTLAVVGYVQPLGSIMAVGEMQARLYFDALSGHTKLPSKEKMAKSVEMKRKEMARVYVDSQRHTIQVPYTPYMDEMANMIGCKPNLLAQFFTDPKLWWTLFFGPNVAYQYRLRGPHPWKDARQALLTLSERVVVPTRTREPPMTKPQGFPLVKTVTLLGICAAVGFHVYRSHLK
uniref:Flavin-containing monooxygenase n=1 Tax=Steinernema glaseri TaxID=37863 RepID=A0A1I7YSL5_9BILA